MVSFSSKDVVLLKATVIRDPIAVPPPSPTTTADFILGYFDEDTNEHLDFGKLITIYFYYWLIMYLKTIRWGPMFC